MNTCGICFPFSGGATNTAITEENDTNSLMLDASGSPHKSPRNGTTTKNRTTNRDDDSDGSDGSNSSSRPKVVNGVEILEAINENSQEETSSSKEEIIAHHHQVNHNNNNDNVNKEEAMEDGEDDDDYDAMDPPPIREIVTPVSVSSMTGFMEEDKNRHHHHHQVDEATVSNVTATTEDTTTTTTEQPSTNKVGMTTKEAIRKSATTETTEITAPTTIATGESSKGSKVTPPPTTDDGKKSKSIVNADAVPCEEEEEKKEDYDPSTISTNFHSALLSLPPAGPSSTASSRMKIKLVDGKVTTPTGQLIDTFLSNMKTPKALSVATNDHFLAASSWRQPPSSNNNKSNNNAMMMMTPKTTQQEHHHQHDTIVGVNTLTGNQQLLESLEQLEERNFDNNPTSLYLHLMKKEWNYAYKRILEHSKEASIWIYRNEIEDPTKLRWKLLPIHAALIFHAPDHIVDALLVTYPDAVMARDDQGMLPIHLSVRMNTPRRIMEKLVQLNPDTLTVCDGKGRTPQVLAEQSPNIEQRDIFLDVIAKGPKTRQQICDDVRTEQTIQIEHILRTIQKQHTNEMECMNHDIMEYDTRMKQQYDIYIAELQKKNEQYDVIYHQKLEIDQQLQNQLDMNEQMKNQIVSLQESITNMEIEKKQMKDEMDQMIQEKEETDKALTVCISNHEQTKIEYEQYQSNEENRMHALQQVNDELNEQVASLEKQLQERCDSEQALAWQVAALAEKLETHNQNHHGNNSTISSYNNAASINNDGGGDHHTVSVVDRDYIRVLEKEREELKATVNKLSIKLYKVVGFLDEMVQEQESIVREALKREAEKRVNAVTGVAANTAATANATTSISTDTTTTPSATTDNNNDDNNHVDVVALASSKTNNHDKASIILDSVPASDRQKLVDNVSGMKNQIIGVIDSVIDSLPKSTAATNDDDSICVSQANQGTTIASADVA